jgi:hypothetical protein
MDWITRERPKIDRVACPWLITRFIDRDAVFHFVPPAQVLERARALGATPFDVEGVELSHDGPRCSFDAVLEKYGLQDPALEQLAAIIRGADTDHLELAPQAATPPSRWAHPSCFRTITSCCAMPSGVRRALRVADARQGAAHVAPSAGSPVR